MGRLAAVIRFIPFHTSFVSSTHMNLRKHMQTEQIKKTSSSIWQHRCSLQKTYCKYTKRQGKCFQRTLTSAEHDLDTQWYKHPQQWCARTRGREYGLSPSSISSISGVQIYSFTVTCPGLLRVNKDSMTSSSLPLCFPPSAHTSLQCEQRAS